MLKKRHTSYTSIISTYGCEHFSTTRASREMASGLGTVHSSSLMTTPRISHYMRFNYELEVSRTMRAHPLHQRLRRLRNFESIYVKSLIRSYLITPAFGCHQPCRRQTDSMSLPASRYSSSRSTSHWETRNPILRSQENRKVGIDSPK